MLSHNNNQLGLKSIEISQLKKENQQLSSQISISEVDLAVHIAKSNKKDLKYGQLSHIEETLSLLSYRDAAYSILIADLRYKYASAPALPIIFLTILPIMSIYLCPPAALQITTPKSIILLLDLLNVLSIC